ncbi:MAG: flagellar motor protein MotB [Candidatus Hydrogenedentes bacterium]|nr:flagellar motor protein MotB [Candidatus Hydrogenedentota bacterium]
MPREKKQAPAEPGAPAWMVTYGDLMGLLLTFFILLISFSTIDQKKITQAVTSVQIALGVHPMNMTAPRIVANMTAARRRVPRSMERAAREFRSRLQMLGMEDQIEIKYDGMGGLELNLPNQFLFDLGRAELKPEAYEILNGLASSLAAIPGKRVEIRGHTDNVPIGGDSLYADNYDLSYHRAKNVMLQMTDPGGIKQEECEVIACGPSQPVGDNNTEEGRQANRRVQIHVRGDFSEESQEDMQALIEGEAEPPAESPAAVPESR